MVPENQQDPWLREYPEHKKHIDIEGKQSKSTLLSIFQFVYRQRDPNTVSNNPEYKNTNMYTNMYMLYIYTINIYKITVTSISLGNVH